MKLLLKQQHAVFYLKDKTTTEILYGGAAGGGKSALDCLYLIEQCQKYKGSRWMLGRSKLKTLKETTLQTFFELTSRLGIQSQINYNAQNSVIHFKNGSDILLKDLFLYPSDPEFDSLGSLEICGGVVDECSQITYKAWQVSKSRCRYRLKDFDLIPKMLGTCNPSKNWTYSQIYKHSRNNTLAHDKKFIQALPTDNPYLPKSYLETLLSLDKNSRERLYYGNWEYDDDPATLIEQDAVIDYFNPTHLKINPYGIKYMTIDVARKGKDKTVFRIWNDYICTFRFEMKKCGLDEIVKKAKEFQLKYNIPISNVIADEDGVGGGVVDFLKCKGFVNNSRALNNENYDNLKSQCSFFMAKKINDREAGEICLNKEIQDITAEEMEQVKQKNLDQDGKLGIIPKEVVKQNIGRSPDEWDSIMMRGYFNFVKSYSATYKAR
jgi:PBSX family phage terminase large subunit